MKRRIIVVGGGSAGWMAAAYLNGALNRRDARPVVDITLVESPDIPRISVGEATVPSIKHVLSVIGIDEATFMKAADATYKQSIRYQNWLHNDSSFYHHPFSRYRVQPIDRSGRDWLASDRSIPFMETVSAQPVICDMARAPRMLGQWDMGSPLSYAFHMNAQKFADYLRDFSVARGIVHKRANVSRVHVSEAGAIGAVELDTTERLKGDLYIDCTGLRAKLIGQALDVPYEDYSQWLLCNQALVARIRYKDYYPGLVRPYTTATALSAGWIWDIPQQDQRSIGYVHASNFIDEAQAFSELKAYEGPHAEDIETHLIRFRVGQRRAAWFKNCIAIGLSGGFIEPLESTGLYLCDLAAVMLAEHFPYMDDMMSTMAFRFNRIIHNRYLEILDFINMHYCLSRRTDSAFWREVQKPERITDRLQAKFEFWKIKPPSASDFEDQFFPGFGAPLQAGAQPGTDGRTAIDTAGLWNHESYEAIMYGMHFCGERLPPTVRKAPQPIVHSAIIDRLRQAKAKLPLHDTYLHRVLGMPVFDYSGYSPPGWAEGRAKPF